MNINVTSSNYLLLLWHFPVFMQIKNNYHYLPCQVALTCYFKYLPSLFLVSVQLLISFHGTLSNDPSFSPSNALVLPCLYNLLYTLSFYFKNLELHILYIGHSDQFQLLWVVHDILGNMFNSLSLHSKQVGYIHMVVRIHRERSASLLSIYRLDL